MVTSGRAAALILFAGLFAATLSGEAAAASSTAVASGQDDSPLSRTSESAMLRGLASTRGATVARKLQQFSDEELAEIMKIVDHAMLEGDVSTEDVMTPPPPPYMSRRSLMGVRSV
jgi:hypothetical protein